MAAIVATASAPARPAPSARAAGAGEHAAGSPRQLGTGVAEALIDAMEAKDPYLRGHSQRVAHLAGRIAEALGLEPAVVDDIRLAGRLHDVGMVGIRESILNKPDVLTPDEIRQVREHVRLGVEILSPLPGLGRVLEYVQDHHERHDGCGYPRGVAGEAISLGGRILAAADAFDALTSPRAYREPLSPEACLSRLAGDAGRALDPRVFAALRQVVAGEAAPRPEPVARDVYVAIV
jgi:HD-GYP domain-containing protein (c-di-GMP phosphodiesterase class II)